jgi:hypothetical protein
MPKLPRRNPLADFVSHALAERERPQGAAERNPVRNHPIIKEQKEV